MASAMVTVGKAISTYINAGSYSQTFTSSYGYLHDKALDDLANYIVLVTPQEATLTQYTELRITEAYAFQIVIAKQLTYSTLSTQMDSHMQLVDEIYRRLWPLQSDANNYDVNTVEIETAYDQIRLREQCVALSVIRVVANYGGTM